MRKICVAGVGAVGSLLAAMIGNNDTDCLSLIARGKRAEALKQNGVVLNSEFYGKQICHPAKIVEYGEELETQDCVIVCVKNYSLDAIASQIRPCVGPDTIILPVMNGVEAGDRLRELFPDAIVCDGLIYTTTGINPDYSATQVGSYTYLYIGSRVQDRCHEYAVAWLNEMFSETHLDVRIADDIQSEIWQKFILNCAFNTVTARYLITTGEIRRSEKLKQDFYELLLETYRVAVREGVKLPADIVEQKYQFMLNKQSEQATSSMKRDVEAERKTELDAFGGAIIRKAEKYQIPVPVTKCYYDALLKMQH